MHASPTTIRRTYKHAHVFAGLGGGAKGFNSAAARYGSMEATFRCLGGIDVDHAAIKDFERIAGTKGSVMDLFDRGQYVDFHGHEPPAEWREATTDDMRAAFGNEDPDIVFLSAPCKGFSSLLSTDKSKTKKYQALNRLTLRGIWLTLEAYSHNPPALIIFENVPKIVQRGRQLLDQIVAMLRSFGYATAETSHDCGVIGGLAQSRKRFLLVARHMAKVPPFLYEPPKRPLRGVGEILSRLPLPQDPKAGPMHGIASLQWQTWVRLACVRAGSDWRSLRDLAVEDGNLRDYLLVPDAGWHHGAFGVNRWDERTGVITSGGRPSQGRFSVGDPREAIACGFERTYRMIRREETNGGAAMPDPKARDDMYHNAFKTIDWHRHAQAVTGQHAPSNGALCVADPRSTTSYDGKGKYRVTPWTEPAGTVIAASTTGNGAFAVADERVTADSTSGPAGEARLPAPTDRGIAYIRSIDGTWHRPLTTLELACLQSLVEPEEHLELEGLNESSWRERIGNAVPAAAAQAVAETMGRTLLMAEAGETFMLSSVPIWVQPVAVALSVAQAGETAR